MTTTEDPTTAAAVDPGPLIRLTIADCAAKALHSAVTLGVFRALADGPADAARTAELASLHPRMATDFLDALTGLGLLERAEGRYRNSVLAQTYLVPSSPSYLGGFVELTNETLYSTWGRLTEALRTGSPQHLDPDKGGFVGDRHQDPAKMKRFLAGLDAYSDRMGAELARRVDWARYGSFTDLGGARGNLAAVLVQAHPHLTATCFDLERTRPLFTEHVGRLDAADRIAFAGGDFFADPLPAADVFVLGHILHGFDTGRRRALLRRVFDAVGPGGTVLVYDRMIDDDRSDPERLLSSLHMRLVSPEGSEYRVADCRSWLREAGFTGGGAEPLLGTHTLITAHKPNPAQEDAA
ncbi:acetylserotonin O-methyltransferase [Streptomyces albipurpureus]|uniref:Acetylserotonin O-methyltransferase n=1 Tax=Streptomyces albipurpureus TaxID=2897419 RepID=A0ABT0UFQ2_9ACTN|nr:acetylserotonin O-methyltransferase [Streptomyces sp. CWNU-1]MCM2387228.1 acetylserotonin O-methyltransferase [Streptomyces sp. CWNU-1]